MEIKDNSIIRIECGYCQSRDVQVLLVKSNGIESLLIICSNEECNRTQAINLGYEDGEVPVLISCDVTGQEILEDASNSYSPDKTHILMIN